MSQPIVVVVPEEETPGPNPDAVVGAMADAFQTGVAAGEDAARREEAEWVPRSEHDALLARVAALEDRTAIAEATADAAAEVAVSAVVENSDSGDNGDQGDEETDGEQGDNGEPRPPERREVSPAPEGRADAPAKAKRTGYGWPLYFGKQHGPG